MAVRMGCESHVGTDWHLYLGMQPTTQPYDDDARTPPQGEVNGLLRAWSGRRPGFEVRSLRASEQLAGSFLEIPAIETAARILAREQGDSAQASGNSPAGWTVSRDRIVARLGGGGMGVVSRAEDTSLRRFVALESAARVASGIGLIPFLIVRHPLFRLIFLFPSSYWSFHRRIGKDSCFWSGVRFLCGRAPEWGRIN